MRLTFINDMGASYVIEVDPQLQLENVMALLEAESGIPVAEQAISIGGRELNDPQATLSGSGVSEDAMLLLRRRVVIAGRTAEQDSEMMRLQILGDPNLMRELQATQPELAAAIVSDPARFAVLLRQQRARHQQAEMERQQHIAALNENPFDIVAQRRIEEAIRQEAVMENLEHAMEYSPESFGRVTMLYVPVEVNGKPVQAFVDSGAQQTIMSPECAEACGIMRLIDTRFSGIAKGVGTARILGRVHSAQLKVADLYLACSFTIMEGRDVDLLMGLDMLKAHQACIDLQKNVLRIQGREVQFLPEHQLPDKARHDHTGELAEVPEQPRPSGSSTNLFPGSGNTLATPLNSATPPSSSSAPNHGTHNPTGIETGSRYPERDILMLTSLGVSRSVAISTLDAAGGNVDIAASLLF